jgi:hypothetical protein
MINTATIPLAQAANLNSFMVQNIRLMKQVNQRKVLNIIRQVNRDGIGKLRKIS